MPQLLPASHLLMLRAWIALVALIFAVPFSLANGAISPPPAVPSFFGTGIEFLLFTLVLSGVAIFNHQPPYAAPASVVVIARRKLFFDPGAAFAHHTWEELPLLDQLMPNRLGLASDRFAGACRNCPGVTRWNKTRCGREP